MSVAIGKPSTGGGSSSSRPKRNYARIKQGKNVWRVLPALGKLAEKGVWKSWHEVIFGFKTTEGYMRPFESCQVKNRKANIIETRDVARDFITASEEELKEVAAALKKSPKDAELLARHEELEGYVGFDNGQYSLEKFFAVNAINLQGEVAMLQIKYKEMLAFEEARKKLIEEDGVDPVDVDGCFVSFDKSGKSFETLVSVTPFYEKDATGARRLKMHVIDDAELTKIAAGYFELDELYPRPSAEEVKAMFEGGPEVVESVMEKYRTQYSKEAAPAAAAPAPKAVAPRPAAPKSAPAAPKAAPVAQVEEPDLSLDEVDPSEEEVRATAPKSPVGRTLLDVVNANGAALQEGIREDRQAAELRAGPARPAAPRPSAPKAAAPKPAAPKAAAQQFSQEEIEFMKENGIDPTTGL
jgi:hypothetical protein